MNKKRSRLLWHGDRGVSEADLLCFFYIMEYLGAVRGYDWQAAVVSCTIKWQKKSFFSVAKYWKNANGCLKYKNGCAILYIVLTFIAAVFVWRVWIHCIAAEYFQGHWVPWFYNEERLWQEI